MDTNWIDQTYEGFMQASETITEWILMLAGGLLLLCLLPFLWTYMWLYKNFIVEDL